MSASMLFQHVLDVVLTAEPAHKEGALDGLIAFFKEGGPFMLINIFWLACSLAVVVERVITLMFRFNLNAPPFIGVDHEGAVAPSRRARPTPRPHAVAAHLGDVRRRRCRAPSAVGAVGAGRRPDQAVGADAGWRSQSARAGASMRRTPRRRRATSTRGSRCPWRGASRGGRCSSAPAMPAGRAAASQGFSAAASQRDAGVPPEPHALAAGERRVRRTAASSAASSDGSSPSRWASTSL